MLRGMNSVQIVDSLICPDNIKRQLLQALAELKNNPRELDKQFELLLAGTKWEWPLLKRYPDTMTREDLYPTQAKLLVITLISADAIQRQTSSWIKTHKRFPYAVIKCVGDNRDFPECKILNNLLINFNDVDTPAMPLHRPGCRCYFITANDRTLDRILPERES